jgi:glyoxylase-like metal-dependent hydrolase (beta-lactamase superfamily II)
MREYDKMDRRRVGGVEVIALIDNSRTFPASVVYPTAGDALARFSGYMDGEGGLALNFASFLLRDGEATVLVDTGWGPELDGRLMAELADAGVSADEIDIVTFTHLHGDHTGWNLDRVSGKPLFPRASYLVPKGDWEHYAAETPPPDSFTRDVVPLQAAGQLELIEGEHRLASALTAIPTPGHTPGHTSILIASGEERGCILGDVVITMVDAEMPSLDTAFDWDHGTARATREATIARLAADGSLVGASHLPVPGFGRFSMDGGASRWIAS